MGYYFTPANDVTEEQYKECVNIIEGMFEYTPTAWENIKAYVSQLEKEVDDLYESQIGR